MTARDKPNAVLINCDDLGWGGLEVLGHPKHKTPILDRMLRAPRGVL